MSDSIIDDFLARITSKLTEVECEALSILLESQERRASLAESKTSVFETTLGKMSRLNLLVEEKGESEAAEQIRDEMDPLWHSLTPEQQNHIGIVSEAIQQFYELGQPTLKLYRLTTTEKLDKFNTFDSVIVCASSKEKAQKMDPRLFKWPGIDRNVWEYSWAQDTDNVTVTLIGAAHKDIQSGVCSICFNAERPCFSG